MGVIHSQSSSLLRMTDNEKSFGELGQKICSDWFMTEAINVFIMGYVTFSLGCYMVCCSVASLAVGYIFELFSFIFIRVLRPSLRPQNYVRC